MQLPIVGEGGVTIRKEYLDTFYCSQFVAVGLAKPTPKPKDPTPQEVDCAHCDNTRVEPVETSEYPPEPCSVCRKVYHQGDTIEKLDALVVSHTGQRKQ